MTKKIFLLEKSTNVRSFDVSNKIKRVLWDKRPSILVSLMVNYFFKPGTYKGVHEFSHLLESGEESYIPVPLTGKHIHIVEIGSGPNIILAHGWASNKNQMTSFVPKLLAAGFSVTLFDQPAHGKSTSVSTNLFDFAAALDAVVRYKKDVHGIIAHSMACAATIYNLQKFPWIHKTVLISAQHDFELELAKWFSAIGLPKFVMEDFVTHLEHQYQIGFEQINPKNVAPTLNGTKILMVHDESDRYATMKEAQKLHYLFSGSEFLATKNLGHARILHDQDVISRVVGFLSNKI